MAYSNGFDIDTILPALQGRVGWYSSGAPRTYESFHAVCTEKNLRATQPEASITDSDWDDLKTRLDDQIIQRCLATVFSKPEQIEQVLLHNRIPGQTQTIANSDKFCGLKLSITNNRSISVNLRSVSVLLDSAATFNLYLYQEGKEAPITTKAVTTVAGVTKSVEFGDILNAKDATTYYVGYFQSELGAAKAIRERVAANKTICIASAPFTTDETDTLRFDSSKISYTDNLGLNADIVSFRDYTEQVLASPWLFDEVIGLSMLEYILEQIISSTRINGTETTLRDQFDKMQLTHYLYGAIPISGVPQIGGLKKALSQKFDDVRKSFYPSPKITVASC